MMKVLKSAVKPTQLVCFFFGLFFLGAAIFTLVEAINNQASIEHMLQPIFVQFSGSLFLLLLAIAYPHLQPRDERAKQITQKAAFIQMPVTMGILLTLLLLCGPLGILDVDATTVISLIISSYSITVPLSIVIIAHRT